MQNSSRVRATNWAKEIVVGLSVLSFFFSIFGATVYVRFFRSTMPSRTTLQQLQFAGEDVSTIVSNSSRLGSVSTPEPNALASGLVKSQPASEGPEASAYGSNQGIAELVSPAVADLPSYHPNPSTLEKRSRSHKVDVTETDLPVVENVRRIGNPSNRKRDGLAVRPAGEENLKATFNAAESELRAPSGDATQAIADKPVVRATYFVKQNDSFWTIAQRVYGQGKYFQALYEHNRQHFANPDQLDVGASVSIPTIDELRTRYPDVCPLERKSRELKPPLEGSDKSRHRIYVVQPDDTLFDIARRELRQASRYVEILHLNQIPLGDQIELPPGMQLRLPGD